ncbi:hypothetical protein K505DRAFT_356313 [Melanomma pulvis-pyrius CBS 109.77]|uniref:Uncharacterized protein n=1 Tax=Melanomma pulvis-pyrius CBS 109.77 TaxID=1314802 RepID=A0A6A6XT07_9PLEO|nr:hypothetical protein K505DRAFT_356313 [Melanomma pulvis-pyrius CBS 109.77]
MKLINAFLVAAFMAAVTCVPIEEQDPASVAVHVEKLPSPPAPQKAGKAHVLSSSKPEDLALLVDSSQSRSVKRDDALEKSAALTWHMTIWDGAYQGGRGTTIYNQNNICYNFINGWSDAISSLVVPWGVGCYFYDDYGCSSSSGWLWVYGAFTVNDLSVYSFNNRISSYICWQF